MEVEGLFGLCCDILHDVFCTSGTAVVVVPGAVGLVVENTLIVRSSGGTDIPQLVQAGQACHCHAVPSLTSLASAGSQPDDFCVSGFHSLRFYF